MIENQIIILYHWYHKCKMYYFCHRDTARLYNYKNKVLGYPAVILNVFSTTSLFATYQNDNPTFLLFIAILSLFASLLSASQNYFEYDKMMGLHMKLMKEYSKLVYKIEKIILYIKTENISHINTNTFDEILSGIELLSEEYIEFPQKIWDKYKANFKNKLKLVSNVNNTSDSIQMILNVLKNEVQDSYEKNLEKSKITSKVHNINDTSEINIDAENLENLEEYSNIKDINKIKEINMKSLIEKDTNITEINQNITETISKEKTDINQYINDNKNINNKDIIDNKEKNLDSFIIEVKPKVI